jgi:dTDP-4-dehydrorhamnose reductase
MILRWIVIGSRGQLGRCLALRLRSDPRHELIAAHDRKGLDLRRLEEIPHALAFPDSRGPDVVVNAAAFTHVDRCESDPEESRFVNAVAPGELASACRHLGARFVHISTDYVFEGRASHPYTEKDRAAPLSTYGRTKLEGDRRVLTRCPEALVARTSWLYGPGRNFLAAILEQAERVRRGDAPPLRVVDDQTGRPTYAADLAEGIVQLVERGCLGLYHLANSGSATWWELARAALDHVGYGDLPVARIRTAQFPRPAQRPAWSVLDLGKAARAGVQLRPWREALAAYLGSEHAPGSKTGGDA